MLIRLLAWLFFLTSPVLAAAQPCQYEGLELYTTSAIGTYRHGLVSNECEIATGIIAAKDAVVILYDATGEKLAFVWPTAGVSQVKWFRVAAGAKLSWHRNGELREASHFLNDTEVAKGIYAKAKDPQNPAISEVVWDDAGRLVSVQILANDLYGRMGRIAKACSSVTFWPGDGTVRSVDDRDRCKY